VIKKWRSLFFQPFVIGFVISALVIFILLQLLPKYNAVMISKSNVESSCLVYYFDLNNDGKSEKINYFKYQDNSQPNLYLYDHQDAFIALWVYNDKPVRDAKLLFNDFNNDLKTEIFSLHQNNDSLFLYGIQFNTENKFLINRHYLTSLFSNYTIISEELTDMNNDKFSDLFFVLRSENQPYTSKFVAYDIQNKKIIFEKNYSASISSVLLQDYNNDSKIEFFVSCKSNMNNGNGTQAGIMSLDNNLNPIFNPINFIGKPSDVTLKIISVQDIPHLVVLHSGIESEKTFNTLMLFDFYGKKIKEKSLICSKKLSIIKTDDVKNHVLIASEKKILTVNNELEIVKEKIIGKEFYSFIAYNDVDENNDFELIFKSNNEIVVFSDHLNHIIRINAPNSGMPVFSLKKSTGKSSQINLKIDKQDFLIEFYNKNEYMNRYILYLVIYLLITFIIYLLMIYTFKNRKKKQLTQFIENEKDNKNFVNKLEENVENKISGLKKKVLEIKNVENDEAYNEVIDQINDTFIELKTISEKINRENSRGIYIHDFFNNLSDSSKANNVTINLYPNDEWYEINNDLQNHLFKLIDDTLNHISDFIRNAEINVQLTRHLNYINCIIEIEGTFIDILNQKSEKSKAIDSRLLLLNGKYETDGAQGVCTILNFTIPLNVTLPEANGKKKIKIIIAEDHDVSLFGLITLFKTKEDIEVVGTGKNGLEVLKILEEKTADIVITDISMPGMDGIELSDRLKNEYPDIKVIVFTMYMENWFIEQLTKNGARGFVSKNSRIIELVEAVRQVSQGNYYYCHQFKSKLDLNGTNGSDNHKSMLDSLTSKELQIVEFFSNNMKRKDIASLLSVHQPIMDTYIANIMLKLNAGDEDEIIRIAKKQKFVQED